MGTKAPTTTKKWTRKEFFSPLYLGPNPTLRRKIAQEFLWQSHKFPWSSKEWRILQRAAHELFNLDMDGERPRGRPRKNVAGEPVRLAMAVCLVTGDNANFVARNLDPVFNNKKKGGAKNRIEYLAKKTRQGLAKLTPDEARQLVEQVHRDWGLEGLYRNKFR